MKVRLVGLEYFHVDRQTNRQTDKNKEQGDRREEANSRFSQFCKGT
jgi:hypothetical protein